MSSGEDAFERSNAAVNARGAVYELRTSLSSPGLGWLPCSHRDGTVAGCPAGTRLTHRGGLRRETAAAWAKSLGSGQSRGPGPPRSSLRVSSYSLQLYILPGPNYAYITCSKKIKNQKEAHKKNFAKHFNPHHTHTTHEESSVALPPHFPSTWTFYSRCLLFVPPCVHPPSG